MITISKDIELRKILNSDITILIDLMNIIYPQAYSHFWEDSGKWYVDNQYSKENILKELSQKNTEYYFVVYKGKIMGNLRIIWDKILDGFTNKKTVKLHRLYLHTETQGNGIGKKLLNWLEEEAIKKQYELIWLDAMYEKPQAFQFYKKMGYVYHSHCFLEYELLYDEVRKMSQVYKELSVFTNHI